MEFKKKLININYTSLLRSRAIVVLSKYQKKDNEISWNTSVGLYYTVQHDSIAHGFIYKSPNFAMHHDGGSNFKTFELLYLSTC